MLSRGMTILLGVGAKVRGRVRVPGWYDRDGHLV